MTREEYLQIYTDASYARVVNQIFNDHEAQMKAKDEEIERLNCRAYHAEGYINDLHNHPKDKKFYDAKARSIVAMLFWEAKRKKRHFEGQGWYEKGIVSGLKLAFEEAHSMLKDNQ